MWSRPCYLQWHTNHHTSQPVRPGQLGADTPQHRTRDCNAGLGWLTVTGETLHQQCCQAGCGAGRVSVVRGSGRYCQARSGLDSLEEWYRLTLYPSMSTGVSLVAGIIIRMICTSAGKCGRPASAMTQSPEHVHHQPQLQLHHQP